MTARKAGRHRQPFPRPNLEAFDDPLRVQMALRHLRDCAIAGEVAFESSTKATVEDVLKVHSPYIVDAVLIMSALGTGDLGESAYASPELARSALAAVGGAMHAARMVMSGDVDHSFALVRPPGHHASTSNAMGLCYFNNVAIALRHVMQTMGVERASIVDFDDHHGNGTAEIFYADPNVQYISLHEYDYDRCGMGHFEELGHGEAVGTNINVPLLMGSPDESYGDAMDSIIAPAVEHFEPDIIAVSAGYDPHYADPVGNMSVDSSTFWKFGALVHRLTESTPVHGSFWVLEGGYNPFVMGPCIEASLAGLMGRPCPQLSDQGFKRTVHELIVRGNREVIEQVLDTISPYL